MSVVTDAHIAVSKSMGGGVSRFVARVVMAQDYYAFGAPMEGRMFDLNMYRYTFTGKEDLSEIMDEPNIIDFGFRLYASALGRWFTTEPLARKYPGWSPYLYAANSPILIRDYDGKDIIVLLARNSVKGFGHMAMLVGDDNFGWFLYSNGGTTEKLGVYGPSNQDQVQGKHFVSLEEFANSPYNQHDGEQYYTDAYRITTDPIQDEAAIQAAKERLSQDYVIVGNSCMDVVTAGLKAAGLHDGDTRFDPPSTPESSDPFFQSKVGSRPGDNSVAPTSRFPNIVSSNEGSVISEQLYETYYTQDVITVSAQKIGEVGSKMGQWLSKAWNAISGFIKNLFPKSIPPPDLDTRGYGNYR